MDVGVNAIFILECVTDCSTASMPVAVFGSNSVVRECGLFLVAIQLDDSFVLLGGVFQNKVPGEECLLIGTPSECLESFTFKFHFL